MASKVQKKTKQSVALPAVERTKNTHIGHKCASILTKTRSFIVSCCGMGVATHQAAHQAARTSKFVAVKGEEPCKTSDAC